MNGALPPDSDEALIARCRDADAHEVQRLVGELARRHHRTITGFIHGILGGDGMAAEDLAQEAFVRVYRHARGWEPGEAKFTTWLFTIARNLALNEVRDRKKRPLLVLDRPSGRADESGEDAVAAVPSRGETPLDAAARSDATEALRAAVRELPEGFRLVLVLCDLEQLSYEECAETLAIPIGTVRSRLARARSQLSERLRARGAIP